jgi:hypothetical protein
MRNGFLGSLLLLGLSVTALSAQAPVVHESPSFVPDGDTLWQPPRTELDDRPNLAPKGYAFYGQAEYLMWFTERGNVDFGSLFRQGTQGFLGMWLDPQQRFGLEIGGLWLDTRYPSWRGGLDDVGTHDDLTSRFWGAEIDGRGELLRTTFTHLDLVAGFRHLSLDESLNIAQRDFTDEAVTSDRFSTRNRFYGGQLGLEAEAHKGSWSVDVFGKVALGANDATADVNGTTLVDGRAKPGGLLATPALSGRHTMDVFAVLPEVGIYFAYELTNNIRLTAGYSFLYLSDAARPTEQITHGALPATNAEFWGQGVSLGLEFRF